MKIWHKLQLIRQLLSDPAVEELYRRMKAGETHLAPNPAEAAVRRELEFLYYHSLEHGRRHGLTVGRNPQVEPFVTFFGFERITIGDDFVCGGFATLRAVDATITIGNKVSLGPQVAVIGANHGFEDLAVPIQAQPQISEPVVIEDDVWVGTGAIILPGVTLGRGSVVGAHAVVTGSVGPRTVVAGNPAHPVRERR